MNKHFILVNVSAEYVLTFRKHGKIKNVKFKPLGETRKEKRADWWYNLVERKCMRMIKRSLKDLRLDYLNPETRFTVEIEMFYDSKEKKLELWKPFEFDYTE